MTTLRQVVESTSVEVQASWPFFARAFDQFLRDYPASPQFIAGKSNEEIGIAMKVVSDIRSKIAESATPLPQPTQSKVKKLKSITRLPDS
jgi:hypothetical protein